MHLMWLPICALTMPMDAVFKALADPSRRRLLDRLNARSGQSRRELCDGLSMARQSVTKHLAVLEAAGAVTTSRRGRSCTSSTRRVSTTSPSVGWTATTARAPRHSPTLTRTGGPRDERDRVRLHHLHRHDARAAVAGAHRSRFHAALLGCRALLRLAGRLPGAVEGRPRRGAARPRPGRP